MKQAVLSLSGGMDSSSLLLLLLAQGYQVTALSFDYGQKHKMELERATQLVEYINGLLNPPLPYTSSEENEIREIGFDIDEVNKYRKYIGGPIKHQIIKLDGLSQLLNSSLVEGGSDVPEGHYEQDNMKETVVPNRNKIFSSIIQAVALSIANKNEGECSIAMGIHAGDHAIYPDCRKEFRDIDYKAFLEGNWDAEGVVLFTPYLYVDKFDILKDGLENCQKLGLDFDEVYKRTNTSYKPIFINPAETKVGPGHWEIDPARLGEAKWYSDYKSAASVERIEAFIKLGRPDPVEYADETGPVTWEIAKAHVEKVLAEHK